MTIECRNWATIAWILMGAFVALLASLVGQPARAGATAVPGPSCWTSLANITEKRLVCTHEAWMTDEERAEVKRLTRGYLKDARCTVSVDVDAALVSEAIAASDRVIDIPPQPVTCALETSSGPMTIGGTFAPHVVLKDGFAVSATPGLSNITGVNSYLAWPVVAYVNHAPLITGEMAQMINAFRDLRSGRQAARSR